MEAASSVSSSDRDIRAICKFINSNLGFKYGIEKKYLITSRLNRRLLELGLGSYRQYLEYLRGQPEEEGVLYALLTTGATSFFREPKQFTYLEKTLLPELKGKVGKRAATLRSWSAGCSSGEEAYSIAMSCLENLGENWEVRVLASDINAEKIKVGAEGIYTAEQLKTVPPEWRRKYFRLREGEKETHYQVLPELRRQVFFRVMNLLESHSLPARIRFSLIFCRNVFIYLNNQARQESLNRFYQRLHPGGYLFLGHSESINTAVDSRWLRLDSCIYQKKG